MAEPDLWAKLGQDAREGEEASAREAFVLFAGQGHSGKTSLLMSFLNANATEKPKATKGLDYTYGRKTTGVHGEKAIAHVWELGGGDALSELVSVPITPQRLATGLAVLVIDMSKPRRALIETARWLELVASRAEDCLKKLESKMPAAGEAVRSAAAGRVRPPDPTAEAGAEAASAAGATNTVQPTHPSPVPIVLCLNKFDQFSRLDSARRRPILHALRYAAWVYGAALVTTSHRDRPQLVAFRALTSEFAFGVERRPAADLDSRGQLTIPAGRDSLSLIGAPEGVAQQQLVPSDPARRVEQCLLWQPAVEAATLGVDEEVAGPPLAAGAAERLGAELRAGAGAGQSLQDLEGFADEAAAHAEPVVDAARTERALDLVRYVRTADRKLKEAAVRDKAKKTAARKGKKASGSRSRAQKKS